MTMNDTVLIALLTLIGTLVGTFGGIITSTKLVNYRLEQLEQRVNKHNNLIDRTYELERQQTVDAHRLSTVEDKLTKIEEDKS